MHPTLTVGFWSRCSGLKPTKRKCSPLSLTDPDARSMKRRDGGIVGYNVQTAVDTKNHLNVAHEVITESIGS